MGENFRGRICLVEILRILSYIYILLQIPQDAPVKAVAEAWNSRLQA